MRSKPIVVGVDGSLESRHAARMAYGIARARGTDCQLVYAFPDLALPAALGPTPYAPGDYERVRSEVARGVAESVRGDVPDAVVDGLDVQTGRAADILRNVAERLGATLVVVGGRHHGVMGRSLGGSTAHRLVRTANVPVFVTGPELSSQTRVLVAIDLSQAAAATLAAAAAYARALGAELRVLHVVEPVRYPRVVPLTMADEEFQRRSEAAFGALVRESGLEECEQVVRWGPATETIAAEAAAWKASVLVVGSHGKGFVDRLLIGSTTEQLLNLLPTSLLVVPAVSPPQRVAQRRTGGGRSKRRPVTGRVS